MITPVTETYSHNGSVQRAIFMWLPNPSLAAEADKPGVKMKIEVAAKKHHRARKGTQHADLMLHNSAAANENVANKQENRRCPVQAGVDGRKLSERNQGHEKT